MRGRPVPSHHCRPPRPSSPPAPGTPPVRVSTTDAVALLFLPPALSLVHPALYLPASIFIFLSLARNSASLLAAPPLLSTATTMPTTSAASKPRGNHCRRTTSRRPPSLRRRRPRRPGQGGQGGRGEGHRTQRPVATGIAQTRVVVSLSSSSSAGALWGGSAPGGG